MAPPGSGVGFEHFVGAAIRVRKSFGTDARARARRLAEVTGAGAARTSSAEGADEGKGGEGADEVSDDDEQADEGGEGGGEGWNYPVAVPEGASPGTVITVPLPGNQVAYATVPEGAGGEVTVPMNREAVAGAIRAASLAAAAEPLAEGSGGLAEAIGEAVGDALEAAQDAAVGAAKFLTSGFLQFGDDDDEDAPLKAIAPGPGAAYCAAKGREWFCLNTFTALREAASLKAGLPPLSGWMLKRGSRMTLGRFNTWKPRYFRLEGSELVYYEAEPGAALAVDQVRSARPRQPQPLISAATTARACTALSRSHLLTIFFLRPV